MGKNQEQRLTDKGQERLFDAVRTHCAHAKSIHETHPDATTDAYELVKDALSMPFTIFTTKHKKVFMKLHDELTSFHNVDNDNDDDEQRQQKGPLRELQLVDIDNIDGYLTLLSLESGETIEGIRIDVKSETCKIICNSIEKDDVFVTITSDDNVLSVRTES